MRPSVVLAKLATGAVWRLKTRTPRDGRLVPVVLCYHRVLPRSAKTRQVPEYSVTPKQFTEQMTLLNEEGFTTLSLEDYYEATQGRRELPDRTALVTFDDGFADNYLEAWPIARRIGVNLNLFICTALVSGNTPQAFQNYSVVDQHSREEFPRHWQPLTCNQLREMATAGVGIGFHSHNHLNLGTLTSAEITLDTSTGVTIFQQCLQRAPQFFAFPYGHFGSYSQEAVEVLSDNGFEMFFSTELGRTQLGNADQVISRIVIHPEDNINSFRRKLFGGYDWVGRVRRRVYAIRSSFRKPPNRLSRA